MLILFQRHVYDLLIAIDKKYIISIILLLFVWYFFVYVPGSCAKRYYVVCMILLYINISLTWTAAVHKWTLYKSTYDLLHFFVTID